MDNASRRPLIYLIGFASIFAILFGIRASADVLNPILLAAVITVTVLPVPSRLTKAGMPGWLALVLSILMVAFVLGLVILTVFFSATRLTSELPLYVANTAAQAEADINSASNAISPEQIQQTSASLGVLAQQVLLRVGGLLVQFGLALAIFFFMISAAMALPAPSRLGLDPNAPSIERIASLTGSVRRYLTVLTGVNFMVGFGNTILLLILGVNHAFLWGLLAWFMGYIPSIGFMIALIPPVLLAYAEFGMQTALVVLVGYVVINGGVQNLIQPKLMGRSLQISPLVVFVGLFVWGYLLGGIGALLAVPLTMLVIIVLENFENTRVLARLLRYTGESEDTDGRAAMVHVRELWARTRRTIVPAKEAASSEQSEP